MSNILDAPVPNPAPQNPSVPLKRKRGWQTNILAFAVDESSDDDDWDERDGGVDVVDEGPDGWVDDEEDVQLLRGDVPPGASTADGKAGQGKRKNDVRALNRDQLLMRELDLSKRPDPALYSRPPTIQQKSKPQAKAKSQSKLAMSMKEKMSNKSSVVWGVKPVASKSTGTSTATSGVEGSSGSAGDKVKGPKGPNWNTTGSKKTSIQQKISSFTTVQKRPIGASSSVLGNPSSKPIPAASKSISNPTTGIDEGHSKSGGNEKDGGAIRFGTLPDLSSCEAKSYPIVKGFEKQRALPTVSVPVSEGRGGICASAPRNMTSGMSGSEKLRRENQLEISDADVIEYLSPKRIGSTNCQATREALFETKSKQLSGQEKLQRYRLGPGHVAKDIGDEREEPDSECQDKYDRSISPGIFEEPFQTSVAGGFPADFGKEALTNLGSGFKGMFNVQDDHFGNEPITSDTVYSEEIHLGPSSKVDYQTTFPPIHPYIIQEVPSSPSPVRSLRKNDAQLRNTPIAKMYGVGAKSKSIKCAGSKGVAGLSDGIARRAFEIASGKVQDDMGGCEGTDGEAWSTLPSRKSILPNKSGSKKISAPFFLPGGLFNKRQPNPLLFSTPSPSQPPQRSGKRSIEQEQISDRSSPLRKITMFKPSRNPKVLGATQRPAPSPLRYTGMTPAYRQQGVTPAIQTDQQVGRRNALVSDLPGTTAISRLLLEASYSDPLSPPLGQPVWTTDMFRQKAPHQFHFASKSAMQYLRGEKVFPSD